MTFSAKWERRLLAMHGATDSEVFIKAVFDLLMATVECDFALANLRNVDSVPLEARDSLGRRFGPEYMERFFKLNPSVPYVMMRPGLRLLPTRGHLPEGEKLKALPFYREFMKPEGWRHSVALLFWGLFPPLPQNAFCVFRSEDQPDFDDDDLARLRVVHPHVATALKRLRKQLRTRATQDGFAVMLKHLPVAAVLLDWDLCVVHQSQSARTVCARWSGLDGKTVPRHLEMPPEVLDVCRLLKEAWRDAIRDEPTAQVLKTHTLEHPHLTSLRAEISLIHQQDSVLAYPGFLVHLLDGSPAMNAAQSHPSQLAALTQAEREAVLLAVEGLDNQEISGRLGTSIPAVKLRLHGAYKKLGVQSRSQLMARLR